MLHACDIDTKDWESLRGVITEDFHSETDRGVMDGRDQVIESVASSLAGASTAHHCHTPEITITGPDSATGIWAMQDHVKTAAELASPSASEGPGTTTRPTSALLRDGGSGALHSSG